jgi:hypothetical protein
MYPTAGTHSAATVFAREKHTKLMAETNKILYILLNFALKFYWVSGAYLAYPKCMPLDSIHFLIYCSCGLWKCIEFLSVFHVYSQYSSRRPNVAD